ncbi:DUF6602 domain-containing protein [Desulforhopalus sp. IMCC35007]|uniref:DUF6602 domain-containing protein n=1 Tax=Desulforhopalus sp. IMCC35007 TaxID=2569543 RepID=UPI0010AE8AAF|nr:DUF6602 domain-containing protein [Desulforhopalus sp. IMCC35007]TKB11294.1 hypothetical protein FCL48_04600 [Desulforhopalus sp. IMCC35007]
MSHYRKLFQSRIQAAVAQARSASEFSHQGVKGDVVEILIRELFRPLLPSDVGIASGQILEIHGDRLSRQMDVIIYDRSIVPPILYRDDVGMIPVEAVLYTIEIKTTLNANELKKAHEAAEELRAFRHLPGLRDEHGREFHHRVDPPRSVIFALSSDLTGTNLSEAERYRTIYGEGLPYLVAICVANREYWWEDRGTWKKMPGTEDFNETLGLIGGVANTYKWIGRNRGWPNLGHYLIDDGDIEVTIPSGTMATVKIHCEKCDAKEILSLDKKIELITDNPEGFRLKGGCPKCGGDFVAPPGRYVNRGGLLELMDENES